MAKEQMRVSQRGILFISSFEGFSAKPYLCPANIPTIGFGNTFYLDGRKVSLKDEAISRTEALELLKGVIEKHFNINSFVKIKINQNQFDALSSFAFNVGLGAFKSSTLVKKLNSGDFAGASLEFEKWNKITVDGEKKELAGLSRRRKEEKEMFLEE